MQQPNSIPQIIHRLGGLTAVARALSKPVTTVQRWRDDSRIPSEQWLNVIRLCREKGIEDVNADLLVVLHAATLPEPAKQSSDIQKEG